MNRWRLLACGVAAYAFALIVTAPANLLDGRLAEASQGRLRLTQAQGTLWSGHGQVEVRNAAGQNDATKAVAWRLRPATLIMGRVTYALRIEPGKPACTMVLSWSGIEFTGVDLALPAATLGSGIAALAPLGLSGEVQVRVDRLVLDGGSTRGSATMQWRSAGSALSPVSPLGDFELRLEGLGPQVSANLRTLRGPLELVGHGRWPSGERPEFVATARMPPDFRQALAPFLRLIAVERADGSFEWQLK